MASFGKYCERAVRETDENHYIALFNGADSWLRIDGGRVHLRYHYILASHDIFRRAE